MASIEPTGITITDDRPCPSPDADFLIGAAFGDTILLGAGITDVWMHLEALEERE